MDTQLAVPSDETGSRASQVAIDMDRPDIAILRDAVANHWVWDREERQRLVTGIQFMAEHHPKAKTRIGAFRALAIIDSVNQRREAKLLDILCDRGRDPLPNPAPAVPVGNQTVIGQVNVIAAGDQPASDPMSGLMRLIRSGIQAPRMPGEPHSTQGPSAPTISTGDKPDSGQRGVLHQAGDGEPEPCQSQSKTPADRPEMPAAANPPLLDRLRRNGNQFTNEGEQR
jgi:hypothetical protein